MTEQDNLTSAAAHLAAALPMLDGLGLHLAAADVASAISRLESSELGMSAALDQLTKVMPQPAPR